MFATRRHIEAVVQNPELDWFEAIDQMPNPCAMKIAVRFGCFKYGGVILLQMFRAIQDAK